MNKVSPIHKKLFSNLDTWKQITTDSTILEWIHGYKIPFTTNPCQHFVPSSPSFNLKETQIMRECIANLLCIGAAQECTYKKGQFVSSIFLVPKKNSEYRFILNLKQLNKFIEPQHFKLEDIRSVLSLISKRCYMGSLDLKDAYYHIPIHKDYRKYLRFTFEDKLYEFNCLPFGLCTAPYVFTKLMKPVIGHLRKNGITSVIYLDDLWCKGLSHENCKTNLLYSESLFKALGFTINYEKSAMNPSMRVTYLGHILDSKKFVISLPSQKIKSALYKLKTLLQLKTFSIRFLAEVIGTLVSCKYAIPYGQLHTRILERVKIKKLKLFDGSFDAKMSFSSHSVCKKEISWWIKALDNAYCSIRTDEYSITIFTDASLTGWGATANGNKTHGWWNLEEQKLHINELELLAILYGLKSLCRSYRNSQILVRSDNTTAIAYINRQGGTKFLNLHKRATQIWNWCENQNNWIFATYIASRDNTIADSESRVLETGLEWELNDYAFREICIAFGKPDIDLFATKSNSKCSKYASWLPDPGSMFIDAFTISWTDLWFYAFPPFSLVNRVIRKIINDRAKGIIVVPKWPMQPWYPEFERLTVGNRIEFLPDHNLLLSSLRKPHPLCQHLTLVAAQLSAAHL